jgi:solute carrier family 10 (sodium/bile acid cotransporter), member 7
MATLLFPAATVSTIVLPLMLFHQVQLMACAAISRRFARSAPEASPPTAAAPEPGGPAQPSAALSS